MALSLMSLPSALFSSKPLLQSRAFRQLVSSLWQENELKPGTGVLSENASRAIPAIVEAISETHSLCADRLAWLLGLLAEAQDSRGICSAASEIRQHLPVFLDAVERQFSVATRCGVTPSYGGLLYLLGHFREDAVDIMTRLALIAGQDTPGVQALGMVFATAKNQPERSKFILTYLGAEASSRALDFRSTVSENALVCPSCRGRLDFQDGQIRCGSCDIGYDWIGDIPDLVKPGCAEPEQYPESIVDIYEAQSRPRFVRTMACDWSNVVTPACEEAYIKRFLQPVAGPVVDLACGAGGWTKLVAGHVGASDVIALDYSVAMLEACGNAVPGISLVRASASALPFADASLGGMNCSDALQALPDPVLAFAEASRCLRPGAHFTVFTFREATQPYAYFQHRLPASARLLFSDEQIYTIASNAGMDVVDMGGCCYGALVAVQ